MSNMQTWRVFAEPVTYDASVLFICGQMVVVNIIIVYSEIYPVTIQTNTRTILAILSQKQDAKMLL